MTVAAALVHVMLLLPLMHAAPQAATAPADRQAALAEAAAELAAGRRAEAERLFAAAAARFDSVSALLQVARIRSGDGNAAGALEALTRARELAPNSEEVLSAFAQVSLAARSPVAAILVLEPLTRMAPGVPQHQYLLGVALMQAGDMPAAVDALRAAERLEPGRALTLVALGLALNNRKLYDEARDVLRRGLDLEPESLDAAAALAEAEEGLDNLQDAEALASRVLARNGGHPTANLVLGLVRMHQRRYEEARDAFQAAAAGDPASPKAYYQLSLAYARLGDPAASQKYLETYQARLREAEERLGALHEQTGLPRGGMER